MVPVSIPAGIVGASSAMYILSLFVFPSATLRAVTGFGGHASVALSPWKTRSSRGPSSPLTFRADELRCAVSPLHRRSGTFLALGSDGWSEDRDDEDDDDEEEEIDLGDQDWRAFRAKLVMQKPEQTEASSAASTSSSSSSVLEDEDDLDGIGAVFQQSAPAVSTESAWGDTTISSGGMSAASFTPLDPSQWAYDSGKVIEQGAVILGGVEQEFGFGLRQQYFHKAVILVLDHDEKQFTKGIILNRPTDWMLDDEVNDGVKWRVWFGGDVQGMTSIMPDIVCLHSLKDEEAVKSSVQVMKDIQWTTFENAKKLVKSGVATPSDFWVFCGYAGWGPGQLMGELDRKSWYMVATDSQTLLKELAKQSAGADPRDAGLDTWELLMNMIGRGETAEECSGDFDDLMLKEWARENLLSVDAGGGSTGRLSVAEIAKPTRPSGTHNAGDVKEGTLVRASSAERSPFLLSRQEYHKSVVLLISDDENLSVGVMLNHPAAKGLEMQIVDKITGKSRIITIPLRYGGEYALKGQNPLLWLHCSPRLRRAQVGSEFGNFKEGIWKCTQEDVIAAIGQGLAKPEDFVVVSGVSVWPKAAGGAAGGMKGEVMKGNFEVVSPPKVHGVWDTLLRQEVLTKLNLVKNLEIGSEAWLAGEGERPKKKTKDENISLVQGLGEGYDEEDDSVVFKSDTKVSRLSDDALRSWVATFLLGAPTLGA